MKEKKGTNLKNKHIIMFKILLYGVFVFFGFVAEIPEIILSLAICANVSLIIKTRKNILVLIMFLFFLTYVVNLIPLFFQGEYIFAYPNIEGLYKTLLIHSIFLFALDIFVLPIKKNVYVSEMLFPQKSEIRFYIVAALFVFFLLYSVRGDSIVESGGYGRGETSGMGGIGEYFLVLIPLMYIYSGKSKLLKYITWLLLLLMSLKLLLYGGRIGVLMIGLLYFALYFNVPERKVSKKRLIIIGVSALYIFVLMGAIRSNVDMALRASWGEILLLPFKGNFLKTYIEFFGNQNDIFYSSAAVNYGIETNQLNWFVRLEMFLYNILSLFVPYSLLPEKAVVISYVQKHILPTGGGALLSMYSYLFLSYPGIILLAIFLAWVINTFSTTKKQLMILFGVMVFTTYPRWFGYNAIGLFKISFYIIPVYLGLKTLFQLKNNQKNVKNNLE